LCSGRLVISQDIGMTPNPRGADAVAGDAVAGDAVVGADERHEAVRVRGRW
jgi:hypothetical protein